MRAFEVAHDEDRAVPRLVPIATRRLLGRAAKRAQPVIVTAATATKGVAEKS